VLEADLTSNIRSEIISGSSCSGRDRNKTDAVLVSLSFPHCVVFLSLAKLVILRMTFGKGVKTWAIEAIWGQLFPLNLKSTSFCFIVFNRGHTTHLALL
jgi:hypothetical protein